MLRFSLLLCAFFALKTQAQSDITALSPCEALPITNCGFDDSECNNEQNYYTSQPFETIYWSEIAFCDSTKVFGDVHGECKLKLLNNQRCFFNTDCLSNECERGVCQPCQTLREVAVARPAGSPGTNRQPCTAAPEYACADDHVCSMDAAYTAEPENIADDDDDDDEDFFYQLPTCMHKLRLNATNCSVQVAAWETLDEDWLKRHDWSRTELYAFVDQFRSDICMGAATCHNVQTNPLSLTLTDMCSEVYSPLDGPCMYDEDCEGDLLCFKNSTTAPSRTCQPASSLFPEGTPCQRVYGNRRLRDGCADGLVCSYLDSGASEETCNLPNLNLGDACYGQDAPTGIFDSTVYPFAFDIGYDGYYDPRCPDPYLCSNNTCSESLTEGENTEVPELCGDMLTLNGEECVRSIMPGERCGDDDDFGTCHEGSCMSESLDDSSGNIEDGVCVSDESLAEGDYCTATRQCAGANATEAICGVCAAPDSCDKCNDYYAYAFYNYFNYWGTYYDDDDDETYIDREAHPYMCKLVEQKHEYHRGQCVKLSTLRAATRGEVTEGALEIIKLLEEEGYDYDGESMCELTDSGVAGFVESRILLFSETCYAYKQSQRRQDNIPYGSAQKPLTDYDHRLRRCGTLLHEHGLDGMKSADAGCEQDLAEAICCESCQVNKLKVANSDEFSQLLSKYLLDTVRADCGTKTLNNVEAGCCGTQCFVQNCGKFVTDIMGGSLLSSSAVAGGSAGEGGSPASAADKIGKAPESAASATRTLSSTLVAALLACLIASLLH